ncbi:hypothetical protein CAEBREN_30643 [Caenorhabditis brenneri]|uniref:F-box domain-containing protein n=1 Tax=Caenorhabditis brenneri TaxID=135651 RepID=G0P7V2_CAEBE|nr:hypothetical protein CAEBREN_30643 [Caenorhabditis brenneri]
MSPPPTLTDMPSDVMDVILEKLGFVAILTLRKVCRDLRNYIDDAKPEFDDISKISIDVCDENILLEIGSHHENTKSTVISYSKHLTGCLVGEKFFEKENFQKIFFDDFKIIFSSLNKFLEEFEIGRDKDQGRGVQRSENILNEFLKQFQFFFSTKKPLNLKKLILKMCSASQILHVLPSISPKVLEEIEIFDPSIGNPLHYGSKPMELEEIVKTEQWKMARNLKIGQFLVTVPVKNFLHFGKAVAFQSSPHFESFSIHYDDFKEWRSLKDVFGAPQLNQNIQRIGWFFKLPTPENTQFVIMNNYFSFSRHFCFYESANSMSKRTQLPHFCLIPPPFFGFYQFTDYVYLLITSLRFSSNASFPVVNTIFLFFDFLCF